MRALRSVLLTYAMYNFDLGYVQARPFLCVQCLTPSMLTRPASPLMLPACAGPGYP